MCKLVSFKTNVGTEVKVADIKLPFIKNIAEQAEKYTSIQAVILFGSSLEDRCTEKSDIDIAILSQYTVNRLCNIKSFRKFMDSIYEFDLEQAYDWLYFRSISEIKKNNEVLVCRELDSKGKVIYQKKKEV